VTSAPASVELLPSLSEDHEWRDSVAWVTPAFSKKQIYKAGKAYVALFYEE
jgi:hypothetical protein